MPRSKGPIVEPNYYDQLNSLIRMYWRLNQINNFLVSAKGVIGFFVLTLLSFLIIPGIAKYIVSLLFLIALALIVVVPFFISIFVGRAAKRLESSRDGE